jgi:hypothetical protein
MKTFAGTYPKYGLVDAFNPLTKWTSSLVLGIDIGMTVVAAENARSNFVWNIFGQLPAARQALATAFPSLTPSALSAASRKPQAPSGTYDVPIDMSTGAPLAVEARAGGPTQIVLTFGANIVAGPGFAVTLSRLGGGADGSVNGVTLSGSTLTINLSGVVDDQTLVVQIADLRNTSTSASGNYTLQLGVLAGDANGDGSVGVGDLGTLATNYGVSAGMTPATGDFTGDGAVDVADLGVLATNYGKSLASGTGASVAAAASVASPAAVTTSVFNDNADLAITGSDDHRRRGYHRTSVDDLLRR